MAQFCLVNSRFPPETWGGAENYVLRLAKGLSSRGHDVAILTTQRYEGTSSLTPTKEIYEGVPVWRFYPPNISYMSGENRFGMLGKAVWHQLDVVNPYTMKTVEKFFAKLNPDLVHTNQLMGISPLIPRAARRQSIPCVHTLHDYSLICPKSNLLREFTAPGDSLVVDENPPAPCRMYAKEKQHAIEPIDVVTSPSQHVLDVHERYGFFTNIKKTRVQLGVESVMENIPGAPATPSILYAGRHLRAKGLDTLLDAAEELPSVQFHICGSGPYDETVSTRADTQDNILYHGYVTDEELLELRRNTSAMVVPSIWMENSPLAIYESYGAGLPVIGSRIGGIPELIEPGETGALFEPKDASSLVTAIRDLIDSPNQIEKMQTNALEWATNHTIDIHINQLFEQIYKPALQSPGH